MGGDDIIKTGVGADIVIGGIGNDTITANMGDPVPADAGNIVAGDNGLIVFNGTDGIDATLDQVKSVAPESGGGNDVITTGAGDDIIIGGDNKNNAPNSVGDPADTILAGDGNNVVGADDGE